MNFEVLVKPQHNGTECPSNLTETEYCNDEDCPEGKSNKELFISVDFFFLQRNNHVNLILSCIRRCTPARSVVGIQ